MFLRLKFWNLIAKNTQFNNQCSKTGFMTFTPIFGLLSATFWIYLSDCALPSTFFRSRVSSARVTRGLAGLGLFLKRAQMNLPPAQPAEGAAGVLRLLPCVMQTLLFWPQ